MISFAIRFGLGVLFFLGIADGKTVYLSCCYFAMLAACMMYGFEGQLKRNRSVISKMFSPSFHTQLPCSHQAYYTGYKCLKATFLVSYNHHKPPSCRVLSGFQLNTASPRNTTFCRLWLFRVVWYFPPSFLFPSLFPTLWAMTPFN